MANKKKSSLKLKKESALMKKYAGSGKASSILVSPEEMLWIPSRFLALNNLLGGGAPYGKIIEIFGEESSGKSLIAQDFAYCTQRLGGVVMWADAEYAFTRQWAELNGIDLDSVQLYKEKGIELISDWSMEMGLYLRSQYIKNQPILMVIDSLAATDCIENMHSTHLDAKAEMGNRAKAIDKMLRNRNDIWEELGITVIVVNQLRSKIGASKFEDPDTTPGGKATRFYASIRLGMYGGKQVKEKINGKEDVVGRLTSIRVKKNKVAPPKPTIKQAPVCFNPKSKNDIGFDKYHDLVPTLESLGVIKRKKGSSSYHYKDKMLARGEESLKKKLEAEDSLRAKLIRKSGINTIKTLKRKLDRLETNLFPIDSVMDKIVKDE